MASAIGILRRFPSNQVSNALIQCLPSFQLVALRCQSSREISFLTSFKIRLRCLVEERMTSTLKRSLALGGRVWLMAIIDRAFVRTHSTTSIFSALGKWGSYSIRAKAYVLVRARCSLRASGVNKVIKNAACTG